MNSSRMELAVLTDLSASMFVACFMILLIFLSLVQKEQPGPATENAAVEAGEAFHLVRRDVLSSQNMVEQLWRHAHSDQGVSLDLFSDRLVLAPAEAISPAQLSGGLTHKGNEPIRLYVFSNALYEAATSTLGRSRLPWVELSVPDALRDPTQPEKAWHPDFLSLERSAADFDSFRAGLAAILDAAAKREKVAKRNTGETGQSAGADGAPVSGQAAESLVTRIRQWLHLIAGLVFPLLGGGLVLFIERHRLRHFRA